MNQDATQKKADIFTVKTVTSEDGNVLFQMSESHSNHPRFEYELFFYHLLMNGNVAAIKSILSDSKQIQLIVGRLSSNPMRQIKYSAVALISVCTRVSILAGLEEEKAYSFSDETIQKLDKCNEKEDIFRVISFFLIRLCTLISKFKQKYYSRPIQTCMKYITTRLYETITLDELATQCHLSPNYLCFLFHNEVGITPIHYVRDQKLEEAAHLILLEKYTLSEISTLLCFSSQSHFTRAFKEKYGCLPSRYYQTASRIIL